MLAAEGVTATLRRSRGDDIFAACGQLGASQRCAAVRGKPRTLPSDKTGRNMLYAIGDIHGMRDELAKLLARLRSSAAIG